MYNPLIDNPLSISDVKYVVRYIDKLLISLINVSMFEFTLLLNSKLSLIIYNQYVTNLGRKASDNINYDDYESHIKFIKVIDDITEIFFADNEDYRNMLFNYFYPITRNLTMDNVIDIGAKEGNINIDNQELLRNEFMKRIA